MCRSHGRWLELLHAGPQNTSATKVSYRARAGKLFQSIFMSFSRTRAPWLARRFLARFRDLHRLMSILLSFSRTRPSWLATRFLMRIVATAVLIASCLPAPAFGLIGTTGPQAPEITISQPQP